MKEEIILHLNDPGRLEKMYRKDTVSFKDEFNKLYPEIKGNIAAEFWNERLNFRREEPSKGMTNDLVFVIIASIVVAFIAKLPAILDINPEFYYPRNIGFIIFPVLSVYFGMKNKIPLRKAISVAALFIISLIFINLLPGEFTTDTFILSCIHLVLFMWMLTGFTFTGSISNQNDKRLGYLKYNGDLLVMTVLILISGGILSAITINLFRIIGLNIEDFYFENVIIVGLAIAPIAGTYLTLTNPQLVGKVSPVIARIFSPLVLVMLVVLLIAMISSGKDPYNDREFLLIFNAMLLGVLALIFFSVAESSRPEKSRWEIQVLSALSIVTIIVNGIALSAILFRISEWGITPNRAAVLGSNILILANLGMVNTRLIKVLSKKSEIIIVGKAITFFLPVYVIWSVIVTFFFPFIFGFK
jgi:hypothetical protein